MKFIDIKAMIEARYQAYQKANNSVVLRKELKAWAKQQGIETTEDYKHTTFDFVDDLLGLRFKLILDHTFLMKWTIWKADLNSEKVEVFKSSENIPISEKIINEENVMRFFLLLEACIEELPYFSED